MFARRPPTTRPGRRAVSKRWTGPVAALLLATAPAAASADQPHTALRIYGPGGPHEVISECAALFGRLYGEPVVVYRGGPGALSHRVGTEGDLFYGGADYMLEDFDRGNPGVLDLTTAERLHPRRIGIVVRKGNPRGIRGLGDLHRGGVRVMTARLEKMSSFHGEARAPDVVEHTGEDALRAWRSTPEIDAWITYRSWFAVLEPDADFVEIADEDALRYTPIAITAGTPHREQAARFIAFLKSPAARRIFTEHGWD